MDRFGRKMQQTGKNMSAKLTAPIAALGAVSFNVFKNFEFEMSKVKAVSGATAEEFAMLSKNAKDLGASTMFSAREVAQLQTEFAKLGFTATEITQVTDATLALAQASGSNLAQAAEVAGSTLRAFGLDASETGRVTDVMAASFSSSALDINLFADSMKFVAPVAKSAGMSLEQTSAMLAVLANNGIKGSQAGTALRRIISEIGATGKPVSEALKDLAKQGLNLADAKDEVGRSAQSALLVLAEGVDQIAPLTSEFQSSAGAAKEMADIMGDTAFGATKRLESAMEGLGISVGEVVATAVVPLVERFAKFVGALNKTSPAAKRFAVIVSALVAAMGPMLFMTGSMIRNFRTLSVAIKRTGVATKITTAAMRVFNMVSKMNPIGLVIAGVTALAGAFMLLNRKKEKAIRVEKKLSDETKKSIADTQVQATQANNLIETIKSQNISNDQRRRLISKLNTEYKDFLPRLVDEKDNVQDLTDLQKDLNEQVVKKIALMAQQDALTQATERAVEAQKQYNSTLKLSDELAEKSQNLFGRVLSADEAGRLMNSFGELSADQQNLATDIFTTSGMLNAQAAALDLANQEVQAVSSSVTEMTDLMINGTDATGGQGDATEELTDEIIMQRAHIAALNNELVSFGFLTREATDDTLEMVEEMDESGEVMEDFAGNLKKINDRRKFLQDGMSTLGQVFQSAFEAGLNNSEDFFSTLKKAFLDLTKRIVATALAAMALAAILSAVFGGAGAAGVVSFGPAFKGGFKELAFAIGKQMGGIPGLAEGGIVTGPTLALIGEGKESEAVIPLSKLGAMMSGGSQHITVNGRISGQDILLSSEKANRTRTRFRGF